MGSRLHQICVVKEKIGTLERLVATTGRSPQMGALVRAIKEKDNCFLPTVRASEPRGPLFPHCSSGPSSESNRAFATRINGSITEEC